jgi:hypothetical protein
MQLGAELTTQKKNLELKKKKLKKICGMLASTTEHK